MFFLKTRIGPLFNARLNFYVCWSTEVFLSYGSRPITAISLTRRHLSTHCANNIGAKRHAERTNDTNNGRNGKHIFSLPFLPSSSGFPFPRQTCWSFTSNVTFHVYRTNICAWKYAGNTRQIDVVASKEECSLYEYLRVYTKRISRSETGKPNTSLIFQRKSSPRTAPSGSLPTPGDWRTSSSTIAPWRRCNSPSTSPRVRAPTRGTGHSATPRPGRPTPRSPSSLWTCAVWRTSRPTGSSHRRSSRRGRSHFILTHKKNGLPKRHWKPNMYWSVLVSSWFTQ